MKRFSCFFIWIFVLTSILPAQEREVKLKVVQTSDIHGNYYPYDFIRRREATGSLARVHALVQKERETYGENLILLDNGDILQGQPTAYYYNYIDTVAPHLTAEMMNFMGYDAGNMGNHDVETGRAVFDRWAGDCRFPILGANIVDIATGETHFKPYEVLERDGVKIVVLGMITPAIPVWLSENLWKGLRFDDMEETARKWMKIIREQEKPDLVIGMFHIWSVCAVLLVLLGGLFVSLYFYYHTKKLKDELEVSEGALREAKDRAEESSRLKSAFLANMSHEIRTPLNAIVGFSDVLSAGGASEEEQRGYFEIIRTNSDLLLRLINDILDVSRLEADRVILSLESCNVVQICQQVVASVAQARRSTNQFLFECEREVVEMRTDVQRLQQVVINLLSNADKFTKEGTITLKLELDTAGNVAVFSVTDTGCGIPLDKQKRVFERFEKLNEYVQGTGLGLSICKLTVEKWGGEIWIDPAYTDGARFVFTHPMNL